MIRAYALKNKSVYPAGSFHGWQDQFIQDVSSKWQILDPREHRQGAIAKLVEDDMGGVKNSNAVFCYLPRGKRLPTFTYAETTAAHLLGKHVILVDENESPEPVIHSLPQICFNNYSKGIEYLMEADFDVRDNLITEKPATNDVKKLALVGNFDTNSSIYGGKEVEIQNIKNLHQLASFDLMAVAFTRGNRPKEAVALMGAAYTLGVPIILHEPNPVLYPPLIGLTRRVFVGDEGKDAFNKYLNNIRSNNVEHEAKIMYDLFQEFKS